MVFILIGILLVSWICGFVSVINFRKFLGTCYIFWNYHTIVGCPVLFLLLSIVFHVNLSRSCVVFSVFCSYRYQTLISFNVLVSISFEFGFARLWQKYKWISCLKAKRWNLQVPEMRRNFKPRRVSELMQK